MYSYKAEAEEDLTETEEKKRAERFEDAGIEAEVSLLLPRLESKVQSRLTATSSSASGAAGITGAHHHIQLIFIYLVEMGFHHVDQAGLELLTSGDLPDSASQSTAITGVSHRAWPTNLFLIHSTNTELRLVTESLGNNAGLGTGAHTCNPSPWGGRLGKSLESKELETSLGNKVRPCLYKNKINFKKSARYGPCYIAQAGLELLGSRHPPALASRSVRITDVSHHAYLLGKIQELHSIEGEATTRTTLTQQQELCQSSIPSAETLSEKTVLGSQMDEFH
ncbi:hypothetical protein AAY473_037655 [Plecturocebus cupreus]